MENQLHTVLGATGGVGRAVVAALQEKGLPVRMAGRSKPLNGIAPVKADLLDREQAIAAIAGSTHVYLCVGLAYDLKTWEAQWPVVMEHTIAACAQAGARLIFLDNVYMYGPAPLAVPFTETHPQQPVSKKGMLRKRIADTLLAAMASGKVKGIIARAPDFFGPGAPNSVFYISVLERMLRGKAPQSIAKSGVPHTYGFTGDLGRAMVTLALDEGAYGQVWHLPVTEPLCVEDITDLLNKDLGTDFRLSFLPSRLLGLLSWFIPPLREMKEMLYQFNEPYIMSDAKFMSRYPHFKKTGLREAVHRLVASFK